MRVVREFTTTSAAYMSVLAELYHATRCERVLMANCEPYVELTHYSFSVSKPDSGAVVTADLARNAKIKKYTEEEIVLHFAGKNDVESFAGASTFWRDIANEDGTIESAYGKILMYDLVSWKVNKLADWIVDRIVKDRDSRQAVAVILQPRHYKPATKDFPCTCHLQFRLLRGLVHCAAVMRSNDVVLGLPYDMAFFVAFQEYITLRLSAEFDEPFEPGEYFHFAHSMHVYLRDLDKVRAMLGTVTPEDSE